MGTMIQRHQLTEADFRGERFADHPRDLRGNNDLLVLTRPDVIAEIHRQYLEAGADIIETNTFNSTAIAQADYGARGARLRAEPRRREAGARGRATSGPRARPTRPRFVAGSIGPTNRTLSISPDVNNPAFRAMTFDELRDAFKEQARGLIDGGCDLLLLETIFDTLNAKAAHRRDRRGVRRRTRRRALPLMISVTITDRSGRTLSGQTIDAFWVSIAHAQAVQRRHQLRARRARHAAVPRRAGAHRRLLRQLLSERRPAERVRRVRRAAGRDRRLPARVRRRAASSTSSAAAAARRRITSRRSPRRSTAARRRGAMLATPSICDRSDSSFTQFAGLETLTIRPDSNFQMIGERTNVTGSAQFARLIEAGDYADGDAGGARPGARRRQPDRRQHGRRHARLRAGDDRLPQLHRAPSRTSRACRS